MRCIRRGMTVSEDRECVCRLSSQQKNVAVCTLSDNGPARCCHGDAGPALAVPASERRALMHIFLSSNWRAPPTMRTHVIETKKKNETLKQTQARHHTGTHGLQIAHSTTTLSDKHAPRAADAHLCRLEWRWQHGGNLTDECGESVRHALAGDARCLVCACAKQRWANNSNQTQNLTPRP